MSILLRKLPKFTPTLRLIQHRIEEGTHLNVDIIFLNRCSFHQASPVHPTYFSLSETFPTEPDLAKALISSMTVHESFLSAEEEASILAEIEPYLKRMRYEFDHWDNVSRPAAARSSSHSSRFRRYMVSGKPSGWNGMRRTPIYSVEWDSWLFRRAWRKLSLCTFSI